MSVGIGLCINNTRAVLEALFNKQSEFARTPKYRIEGDADEWVGKKYRQSVAVQPLIELALGLYFTATVFYALANRSTARCRSWCCSRSASSIPACCRSCSSTPVTSRWCSIPRWPAVNEGQKSRSFASPPIPSSNDIDRLVDLAGVHAAPWPRARPPSSRTTSPGTFPFPAANTTPWQLEGTIQALAPPRLHRQVCVQNKTVVTNAFKGEDLNHYVPIFKRYDIPVLYNFKDEDMKWVRYEPKARMRVLNSIFPEGIHIPDYFFGKNIVHLPTTKCHIYTTTTGAMKNAFGGLLNTRRHYTHSWIHETLVDLLAIQKEIHSGLFAIMDGTTAGNGPGPRTMYPGGQGLHARVRRSGRDRRGRRPR